MRRHLVAWLVGSLVFVTPPLLAAQQGTGEIAGKVTDEQGAVLPGVAIVVTNQETGVFRDVVSGPAGTYSVRNEYTYLRYHFGYRDLSH